MAFNILRGRGRGHRNLDDVRIRALQHSDHLVLVEFLRYHLRVSDPEYPRYRAVGDVVGFEGIACVGIVVA